MVILLETNVQCSAPTYGHNAGLEIRISDLYGVLLNTPYNSSWSDYRFLTVNVIQPGDSFRLQEIGCDTFTGFISTTCSLPNFLQQLHAELLYGVERSSSKRINRPIIDDFVRHLDVIEWNNAAAEQYGKIRADLEARDEPIGVMDMMIAAHAKSIKAVLVTNNQKHFARIKGLKVENRV